MTLLILLLLILIALVCSLVRWRKTALVMGTLAAFLFVGIGCGPIPAALLGHLQEGYSSTALIREAHSTAIILLGNGTERLDNDAEIGIEPTALAYGRIVKALEIYRACKQKNPSCTIVVTGGDPQHHGRRRLMSTARSYSGWASSPPICSWKPVVRIPGRMPSTRRHC